MPDQSFGFKIQPLRNVIKELDIFSPSVLETPSLSRSFKPRTWKYFISHWSALGEKYSFWISQDYLNVVKQRKNDRCALFTQFQVEEKTFVITSHGRIIMTSKLCEKCQHFNTEYKFQLHQYQQNIHWIGKYLAWR